jgi:hypothetical protein
LDLFILRHGEAGKSLPTPQSDRERTLTSQGKEEVEADLGKKSTTTPRPTRKLHPIAPNAALAKLKEAESRTRRSILRCAKDPKPDAVHDARVAVRKLRSGVRLMPREYRKDQDVRNSVRELRGFYSACADFRDNASLMAILSALDGRLSEGLTSTLAKRVRSISGAYPLGQGGSRTSTSSRRWCRREGPWKNG